MAVPAEPWWRRPSLLYIFSKGVLLYFNISFLFLNNLYPHYFRAESTYPIHILTLVNMSKFPNNALFWDGLWQSAWLIDLVSVFDSSAASYPFSMLNVFITQWFPLLTDLSIHSCPCFDVAHKCFSFCSRWGYVAGANLCSNYKQT